MKIDSFKDGFAFLSNFEADIIRYKGLTFRSVEHAYQAAKSMTMADMELIRNAPTAGAAKRLGRKIQMRPDWEQVKIPLMMNFLRQKFSCASRKAELLSTGNHELIEGNTWGDTFWGVCDGKGENWLGKCLMHIRKELQEFDTIFAGEIL